MAFAGILPKIPSFGEKFAQSFSGGLNKGFDSAHDFAQKIMMEKYKKKQRSDLVNEIENGQAGKSATSSSKPMSITEQMKEEFTKSLPEIEQHLGRELEPQETAKFWQQFKSVKEKKEMENQKNSTQQQFNSPTSQDIRMKAKKYAAAGEDSLAKATTAEADALLKEEMAGKKYEFQRESKSEEKLQEINERLNESERQSMRFGRLQELFSPENDDKFPPPLMAALFSKDGELRPTALAALSEEAQESIKLTYDQLTGAKDTFGGRVTNFDAQTYLKRHPGLLNTAEGRRRVLRDLIIMNDITQLHDSKVLDIIDEYGGAGKISYSKAEGIFRKRYKNKLNEMKEEFINPDKNKFTDLPEAKRYQGRTAVDEETGQKFRSDGKEWIPV